MWKDEIVEEIHRIRDEYAKSFNYDLKAIFTDLRKKQDESGQKVVDLSGSRSSKTRWIKPLEAGATNILNVGKNV